MDDRSPRNTPRDSAAPIEVEEKDTVCDAPSPFAEPNTTKEERHATLKDLRKSVGRTSNSGVRPVDLGQQFDFEDVAPTALTASGETAALDEDDDDVSPRESIAPGEIIDGRYVVNRIIGHGATGVVYEATHKLLGTRLALKCLHPQMSTSHVAVERLFREARIAAGLQHPNVVMVFDAGRDKNLYYLTMELLDGQPLTTWLSEGHTPQEIVTLFLSIMDGVAKVHGAGVVHRDLKPDNVIVVKAEDGKSVPKVCDFGVSKLHEPGKNGPLTALGMTMGTPYYMAPEQFTDTRGVDARADVYSLGIMLYEALANDVPYPGDTVVEIFNKAVEGRPQPLRERCPGVPPTLETVIARAMSPLRDARFESVKAMRDALAGVPFDGSDRTDDTQQPEAWQLGSGAGALPPLDGQPTKPNERLVARTVEMASVREGAKQDARAKLAIALVIAGGLAVGLFGFGAILIWLLL